MTGNTLSCKPFATGADMTAGEAWGCRDSVCRAFRTQAIRRFSGGPGVDLNWFGLVQGMAASRTLVFGIKKPLGALPRG